MQQLHTRTPPKHAHTHRHGFGTTTRHRCKCAPRPPPALPRSCCAASAAPGGPGRAQRWPRASAGCSPAPQPPGQRTAACRRCTPGSTPARDAAPAQTRLQVERRGRPWRRDPRARGLGLGRSQHLPGCERNASAPPSPEQCLTGTLCRWVMPRWRCRAARPQ
jgi:hypothetical protein